MTDSQNVIGLIIYPGMTSLDILGPQQVFSTLPMSSFIASGKR